MTTIPCMGPSMGFHVDLGEKMGDLQRCAQNPTEFSPRLSSFLGQLCLESNDEGPAGRLLRKTGAYISRDTG